MFDKVILAVDGSPESLKAAQLVEALAERFKGEMVVMHVREGSYSGAAGWAPEWTPTLEEGIANLVNELQSRDAKARSEVRDGVRGQEGETIKFRLRGRSPPHRRGKQGTVEDRGVVLGSVAGSVVRNCPMPGSHR